jgi:hypothetical protein
MRHLSLRDPGHAPHIFEGGGSLGTTGGGLTLRGSPTHSGHGVSVYILPADFNWKRLNIVWMIYLILISFHVLMPTFVLFIVKDCLIIFYICVDANCIPLKKSLV